jgi:hypothetical protein
MRKFSRWTIGAAVAAAVAVAGAGLWLLERPLVGQQVGVTVRNRPPFQPPRTPDGKADLNGIWQALGSAHWNLLDHAASAGPVVQMGALGAIPAGLGVVEGGEIPYQPWAAKKQKENAANWLTLDPIVKCYMPGVPRATYMPFPFQIVQTPTHVLLAYEFASASRTVYMGGKDESPADTWMGWSNGRWEGDTLVVSVNSFNDQTWFDSSGNFHSEALKVEERYTLIGPDHMMYEATIEDPKVFTRPWKIQLPLYRRVEPNVQLLEFKCVEFVEELMYGHLRKK